MKSLLKDAIVVGHNIKSDERALCFHLDEVAHQVIDTVTSTALNDLVPSVVTLHHHSTTTTLLLLMISIN